MKSSRVLITSGEPAGIGPDIVIQAAQVASTAELIVVGDPELLLKRAAQLNLPLTLEPFDQNAPVEPCAPGSLKLIPVNLNKPCEAGKLDAGNAAYVLRTLETACLAATQKWVDALVTAPVHKGILNDAGYAFQGHTEFFAAFAGIPKAVMLFVVKAPVKLLGEKQNLKVALVTTHLPLAKVPAAITAEKLEEVIGILDQALSSQFGLKQPAIFVCGLNPHAGESGHLGREEIEVIGPTLEKLRREGKNLLGPLSADTIFTEKFLKKADAIVAMYHDQALPVVKCLGFGNAVNVTLGLPFIRTSVDHGTALDVAGSGDADPSSLQAAINLAIELTCRGDRRSP